MKEQYFRPAVVNAGTLEGSGIIPSALTKMIMAALAPNLALIVTSPPPARKAQGTLELVAKTSSLTERKF